MLTENRVNTWVIGLAGTFILMLSIADIAATKFIDVFGVVTPAGSILFGVIFIVRDALHKTAGAKVTRQVINIAVALNIGVGLFLFAMTKLPAPSFRPSGAFDTIFALAPGIVIGSVVAAFVSQYLNTYVYQWLWEKGLPQWGRAVGSNLVSLPVDAILFTFVGFVLVPAILGADGIGIGAAFARVASGQTVFKALIMLASTPFIYAAPVNEQAKALK